MAYDAEGLQVVNFAGAIGSGGGSVRRVLTYITNDTDTVIQADDYFDNTDFLTGDILMAVIDVDGTIELKNYVVSVGTGDISSNDVTIKIQSAS
jgi:hypothetical protein